MLEVEEMSSRTVLLLSVVALAGLASASGACKRDEPLPSTDRPLAVLEKSLLGGGTLDTAALAGKVVLVNFWSPS